MFVASFKNAVDILGLKFKPDQPLLTGEVRQEAIQFLKQAKKDLLLETTTFENLVDKLPNIPEN